MKLIGLYVLFLTFFAFTAFSDPTSTSTPTPVVDLGITNLLDTFVGYKVAGNLYPVLGLHHGMLNPKKYGNYSAAGFVTWQQGGPEVSLATQTFKKNSPRIYVLHRSYQDYKLHLVFKNMYPGILYNTPTAVDVGLYDMNNKKVKSINVDWSYTPNPPNLGHNSYLEKI